jgi:hypothetical protein
MKCSQCDRPAWYRYAQGGLCIPCAKQNDDIVFKQCLMNAVMFNQAIDEMDAVTGFHTEGGRFPVAAMAAAALNATTNHTNITITDSNVGVVNTGDLANIDAIITITQGSDAEELGLAIKKLTHAILDSTEIAVETKRELVELVRTLSEQVATRRSKPVMGSILKAIDERLKSVHALWSLYDNVRRLIARLGEIVA